MFFWLLLLGGGGYLAYRHYHGHPAATTQLPPVSVHLLTLTPGEIKAFGNKLILLMVDSNPGEVSLSAVDFLAGFNHKLDREAIAHSAKDQGADPVATDRTSLAADKKVGPGSL